MRTGYNDGFPVFAGLSPMSATPLAASVPLDASYTRGAALPALLKSRILILDGAMGTMIQRYKLDEAAYRGERFKDFPRDIKGNNELLSITQPQIIREIHDQYFAAGADIVETNVRRDDRRAVRLRDGRSRRRDEHRIGEARARSGREIRDAGKPRFVAGAIGPTPKTASISPDVNDPGARNVTFDELRASYYQQAKALLDGGVDLFLVETIFDTLNAKAALFALDELFEDTGERLPIMISGTVTDASGRILSGQTVEAFWNSLRHAKPLTFGLNCALGAALMRPYIAEPAKLCDTYVSCYPNAGLPNPMAETGFDETPDVTSGLLKEFAQAGP